MSEPTQDPKRPRNRRVFGRRKFMVNGHEYRIELRSEGVWVRKKHSRSHEFISPSGIVDAAAGQLRLI